jgi:hypothetical protein
MTAREPEVTARERATRANREKADRDQNRK